MNFVKMKILGACVIVLAGAVVIVGASHLGTPTMTGMSDAKAIPAVVVTPPVVHTSSWYLRHQAILKIDEQRCSGNAASIPLAACTNVSTAVSEIDYENAQSLLKQELNAGK